MLEFNGLLLRKKGINRVVSRCCISFMLNFMSSIETILRFNIKMKAKSKVMKSVLFPHLTEE